VLSPRVKLPSLNASIVVNPTPTTPRILPVSFNIFGIPFLIALSLTLIPVSSSVFVIWFAELH